MLKGNKVTLRAEERENLKRLHELMCNRDLVVLSDGHWQPEPLAQWEKQFDKRLEDADRARFVIEADGKVIGGIGLHHRDRRSGSAQFGIGIYDPEYLGRGYGRDAIATLVGWAFEIQNYRRIWLETYALNERAVRSYRALGFVEEGRLREHAFYDGRYVDVLVMGLLGSEWRAAGRPRPGDQETRRQGELRSSGFLSPGQSARKDTTYMQKELGDTTYRRDLGGGLVLRWSTAADVERIAQLYSFVFRNSPEEPLNQPMDIWTHDLMSGQHPLIGPGDFAVAENTDGGAIVAATCLLRQAWQYDQIAFPVGRPEIVATMPGFRNRGLIRSIFELIHARSAAEGHLAQGITGINYYYRQFGYEYAIDLGGRRSVYLAAIPKLKPGEPEPYALRRATQEDLPQVMALYDRERARGPVSTPIDASYWQWTLEGQTPDAGEGWNTWMIVGAGAERAAPVGYVLTNRRRHGDRLGVLGLALEPGVALPTLLPSLLRALQALALELPQFRPHQPEVAARISFALFGSHPVYDALGAGLTATIEPPYAWYVRVPDLPRLIRRIAPALERRLAASSASGFTGELKIDFFRAGLRLAFDQGRLTDAADFRAEGWDPQYNAGFPPLVFLQLLFGRRSLDDLRYAFADIYADQVGRPLLEALFPARASWVVPLD